MFFIINKPTLLSTFILLVSNLFMINNIHANEEAIISIDKSVIIGQVNRNILGNNIIGVKKKGREKLYVDRTGGGTWDPVLQKFSEKHLTLFKKAGTSILRWPGGPWPESMDWKKLVGPIESRRDNTFGLPEFLLLCEKINAVPVITLSAKVEQQAQIPSLIEYLNAPNNGSNPNGGVDWAKMRSNDGRDKPWNVNWFEFGNETFHTNMSPEEYVSYYDAVYAKVMKIDNTILLGAVLEDTDNMQNGWNKTIVSKLGNKMGFVIIHPYFPSIKEREAKYYSKDEIAKSTLSSDELFKSRLKNINSLIKNETGRNDLRIAVTEYNGNFVQNNPIRFRFTLFNAIHNADFVRIMLSPSSNVFFANHFNIVNSYWGMIRETKNKHNPLNIQANFYVYDLYNQFLGENLIGLKINSPSYSFEGAGVIAARQGLKQDSAWKNYNGKLPTTWKLRPFGDVEQKQHNGIVTAIFNNTDVNYYHAAKTFDVKPDTLYRVSAEVKVTDISNGKVGIAVEDVRGWKSTFNQPSNIQLKGTANWQWVTTQIRTLPDTKKLRIFARRMKGKGPISGVAEFGNIRVEENESVLGEVKSITGLASSSEGESGEVFSLVLLNKDINNNIKISLKLPEGYKVDEAMLLSGSTPYSSNYRENQQNSVSVKVLENKINTGSMNAVLPPSSMAGIRLIKH